MTDNDKRTHLGALDGLRGLAALAVFGVHYNQIVQFDMRAGPFDLYTFLSNGRYGVCLFFCLSGFLLGLPFWRAMLGGEAMPGLRIYAARRAARIVPAYFLALGLLVVLGGIWRAPGAWVDILLHVSFLFNCAEFSIFSINPAFWTLAVEMQFYVLLPLLLVVMRRMTQREALLLIVLLGLGSTIVHGRVMQSVSRVIPWSGMPGLVWIRPGGAVVSHSLLAHLPHFLMGVAAGLPFLLLKERGSCNNGRVGKASEVAFWCCAVAVLALLGTGLVDAIEVPHDRYGLPLIPVLLTLMIVAAPLTRIARTCFDTFPIRVFGMLSYGFYLYHVPCLRLTDRTMARFGLDAPEHCVVLGLVGFALSLLSATLSFVAIERPIRGLIRAQWGT